MEVKAGMRRNLLRLQYIHQITKSPHSFFSSQMIQTPYLCMGFPQQPRLFSGGRVVKRRSVVTLLTEIASEKCIKSGFAEKERGCLFFSLRKVRSP